MPQRRLAWFTPKDDGTVSIAVQVAEFPADLYDEFEQVVAVIPEIRPSVVEYLSVETSFGRLSLVESKLAAALEGKSNPASIDGMDTVEVHVLVDNCVSGFLSAAAAFRQRTAMRLRRRYGSESTQLRSFLAAEKAEYDAAFAFRVLYNLRNYAEHFDSPISAVPATGKRADDNSPMKFSVELRLGVSHLLKSPKVQKAVRVELGSGLQQLPLMPLVRDYLRSQARLLRIVFQQQAHRLHAMEEYAKVVLSLPGRPPNSIPVIATGDIPTELSQNVEMKHQWTYFSFDELASFGRLYNRIGVAGYPEGTTSVLGGGE